MALINNDLNALGPRPGFVLSYDTNSDPHIIFFDDVANPRRPAYIVNGEVLGFDLKHFTNAVNTLNLDHEKAVNRMVCALLSNLPSVLYNQKSTDNRTPELAGKLADYAVAGILSTIATKVSPQQPSPATCKQPERN
jgi:hypothetical protein